MVVDQLSGSEDYEEARFLLTKRFQEHQNLCCVSLHTMTILFPEYTRN